MFPADAKSRPSLSDDTPPTGVARIPILRDIAFLHRHLIRFFKGPETAVDAWKGESSSQVCSPGVAGKYGLWRHSALILAAVIVVVVIGIRMKIIVDRGDAVSNEKSKNNALKSTTDEVVAEMRKELAELEPIVKDVPDLKKWFDIYRRVVETSIQLAQNIVKEGNAFVQAKEIRFALEVTILVVFILSVVFLYMSLWKWTSFRTSYALLLIAWALTFVVPFIMALIPYRYFVDSSEALNTISSTVTAWQDLVTESLTKCEAEYDALDRATQLKISWYPLVEAVAQTAIDEAAARAIFVTDRYLLPFSQFIRGSSFGIQMFISLVPLAMSLFPATLKSAVLIRRTFPLTNVVGFIIVSIPFFHIPVTLALWSFFIQIVPSALLAVGLGCIALSTSPFLMFRKVFIKTHKTEDLQRGLKWCQRIGLVINLTGVICIVIFIVTNADLKNVMEALDAVSILLAIFDFLRGMFMTTVFFSDSLITVVADVEDFNDHIKVDGKTDLQRSQMGHVAQYCGSRRESSVALAAVAPSGGR